MACPGVSTSERRAAGLMQRLLAFEFSNNAASSELFKSCLRLKQVTGTDIQGPCTRAGQMRSARSESTCRVSPGVLQAVLRTGRSLQ